MMKSFSMMNSRHGRSFPRFRSFAAAALILSAGLCWSCNQDPIFYDISMEVTLNDPKIPGSPTSIVVNSARDKLYVSNGRIFVYEKPAADARGRWQDLSGQPPGGNVRALAMTGDALYALSFGGTGLNSGRIYKRILVPADSGEWIPIENPTGYNEIQSVFGAGDYLFAGVKNSDGAYAILYLEQGETSLTCMADKTVSDPEHGLSELRGAAFFDNHYYMATANHGIYRFAAPPDMVTGALALDTAAALPGSFDAGAYAGLIPVGSSIYGFGYSGKVWQGKAGGSGALVRSFENSYFTGALAIWENPAPGKAESFLLIGRGTQSHLSGYTFGYYE
ncbi:MAG: hypothetical protein LBP43_02305, partial [Treponema sp.]|nr:hypothetical protein [Treponema sp.]